MSARYVIHRVNRDNYYFTLVTHSGQVLLTSGVYTDKDRALRATNSARYLARQTENYQIFTEEDGGCYFLLGNARTGVLAESEPFPDRESLQHAIHLVKRNTNGARLEDTTVPPPPRQVRKKKKA